MGDELITTKIAEEEHSNFKPLMARARTTIDVNKQEMEAQSLRSEMEKKVDVTNSEAMEAKLTRVKKWKFPKAA
ncbi:hypothetical protein Bca101_030625 [Brassica carinata]